MADIKQRITPAYAGKRAELPFAPVRSRDYPRVCGEKKWKMFLLDSGAGSPPRVRGKAGYLAIKRMDEGITPAYAGKSSIPSRRCCFCRDHPRVCGEKRFFPSFALHCMGSPPRVRGKAVHHLAVIISIRITPACAGKSRIVMCGCTAARDHPRVCGEKEKMHWFRFRVPGPSSSTEMPAAGI